MPAPLHTAVETPTYQLRARKVGLSAAERDEVLDRVMTTPDAGELIRGSGGVRKVRIGRDDGGKSGGYRVLTYFMDRHSPVYLLFVIDKTDADATTAAQTKVLKQLAKVIKAERTTTQAIRPNGGDDEG